TLAFPVVSVVLHRSTRTQGHPFQPHLALGAVGLSAVEESGGAAGVAVADHLSSVGPAQPTAATVPALRVQYHRRLLIEHHVGGPAASRIAAARAREGREAGSTALAVAPMRARLASPVAAVSGPNSARINIQRRHRTLPRHDDRLIRGL